MVQEIFSEKIFGQRVRDVRQKAGMRQQDLADSMTAAGIKVHRSAIAKIESGERPASIAEVVCICLILKISLEALVGVTVLMTSGDVDKKTAMMQLCVEARLRVHQLEKEMQDCADQITVANAKRAKIGEALTQAQGVMVEAETQLGEFILEEGQ